MMRLTLFFLAAAAAFAQPSIPNAVPMPGPEIQYLGANGQPLSGAYLCSFAAGTTTPQATYTDSSAGTPNTNPIVLDSYGRASVWIGPELYKFILYVGGNGACPGSGSVQWSQDNVTDFSLYWANYLATLSDSCSVSYQGSLTGQVSQTVCTKLQQVQNIQDWGAKCDGSTNDQSAFVTALAAFPNNGGTLNLPSGACIVDGGLVIPRGVIVQGSSWGSHIKCALSTHTFCMAHAGSASVIQAGGIQDVYIDGPNITPFSTSNPGGSITSGKIGLYLGGDPSSTFTPSTSIDSHAEYRGLVIRGFDRGIQLGNNAYSLNFFDPEINYNNTGLYIPTGTTATVAPNAQHVNFHGGSFSHNVVAGIDQELVGSEILLQGTGLYYNQTSSYTGLAIDGAAINVYASDAHLEQCFGPIVQPSGGATSGQFKMQGGSLVLQGTAATNTVCSSGEPSFPSNYSMVMFATSGPTYLSLRDVSVFSGHTIQVAYFDGGDAEYDGTGLFLDNVQASMQASNEINALFSLGSDSGNSSYVHVSHNLDTGTVTNGESVNDNYNTRALNMDVPADGSNVAPVTNIYDQKSLRYKWSMQPISAGGSSGGGNSFTFIQAAQTSSANVTITVANSGDALVVWSTQYISPYVTDTQGLTFTPIPLSGASLSAWLAKGASAGSDTISIHNAGCTNTFECIGVAMEYKPLSTSFGAIPGGCSGNASASGGSASSSFPAQAVLAAFWTGATTTFGLTSGSLRGNFNALVSTIGVGDQALSSISSYTNTWTYAGGTGISGNCVIFLGNVSDGGSDSLTLSAYDDSGTFITNLIQANRNGAGSLNLEHIGGIGGVTGAIGSGAGTGPSWALTGSDTAGQFAITTGTSPSANSTIVTITFGQAYSPPGAICVLSPVNATAAGVHAWITGPSTGSVNLQGTLSGSTQYTWNYWCGQSP